MSTAIDVAYEPLTLQLPTWVDTNETYKLVRPDGQAYDVVWDIITNSWQVLPF